MGIQQIMVLWLLMEKKQVGHPSNPTEMAEQLGALDATFVPLSDVP